MIFSYLDETNIFKRYRAAKLYTEQLTRPFPDFERLARNRPLDGIDPAYPRTTDGTTASIIRKTPKRIIQQLPTGSVIAEDNGWLGIVADYILREKIIRHANEDYNLIQKCWLTIEGSLTFGSAATYTPFLNHDGYFSPDLTLPYWGDIFLQRGKKSGNSCSYIFMRAWWQKADIEALIDSETKMIAKSKKSKGSYTPTWDIVALKSVLESETSKDLIAMTPTEEERSLETTGIELVTGFQKGVGASFITFNPSSQKVVRTKENKDPRGKIPIDWMYGDIDGSNPLGRGIVELIGGLQNLIDSDMQMYQFNRALSLAPPVVKYGNIGNFKFSPNTVIKARNPTDKIVALDIDTSGIANYPALYGLQKSQLLNLVNSPDTSISSTVGNPSFSKTSAGVQQQAQTVSVDDNYLSKQFETWFEAWCETAINLYFAERSGIDELQLDKQTAMKLRELPNFDQNLLSPDNKIRIDYDSATEALKFRVDPSTTKKKDETIQVQNATNLLDLVMKYPMLNASYGGPIDTEVLARRIVTNSGIDDPEQVAPEPTEAQKQSKEQQKNTVSPFSPMFDKPSIRMNYPDLPMAAQIQVLSNAGVHVTPQDMMQGPVLDPNMRGVINPVDDPNILVPGGGQAVQSTPGQAPGMGGQANPLQSDGINLTPQEIQRLMQDPRFASIAPQLQQMQQSQPASQPMQQPAQAPQGDAGKPPIDLASIYKSTTDPQIKAEIETMMGLHPDMTHVQNHIDTNAVNHVADQAGKLNSAATALMPDSQGVATQPNAKNPMSQNMQMPMNPDMAQEPTEPAQQDAQTGENDPQMTVDQLIQLEDSKEPSQNGEQETLSDVDRQIIAHLIALNVPEDTILQAIQMLEQGASADQVLQAIGVSK